MEETKGIIGHETQKETKKASGHRIQKTGKQSSNDNLNRGDDYIDTKAAVHIGILDFTLFEEYPEFFASYRLLNVKNHNEYTGKFQLYVLDLNQIELATQEDRDNEREVWARLFQAKTRGFVRRSVT